MAEYPVCVPSLWASWTKENDCSDAPNAHSECHTAATGWEPLGWHEELHSWAEQWSVDPDSVSEGETWESAKSSGNHGCTGLWRAIRIRWDCSRDFFLITFPRNGMGDMHSPGGQTSELTAHPLPTLEGCTSLTYDWSVRQTGPPLDRINCHTGCRTWKARVHSACRIAWEQLSVGQDIQSAGYVTDSDINAIVLATEMFTLAERGLDLTLPCLLTYKATVMLSVNRLTDLSLRRGKNSCKDCATASSPESWYVNTSGAHSTIPRLTGLWQLPPTPHPPSGQPANCWSCWRWQWP